MAQDDRKGSFAADIPQSIVDEAMKAVDPVAAPAPAAEGEPGELERLRAELEMSQAAGRRSHEQLKEEHDRALRALADLENYKKRAQKEKEEVQRFGNERLLKDLLPVVDNLDRALAAAPPDDPLAGGVKLVLKVLEEALAKHGVKSFRAVGLPFDPKIHEAIMTVATAEHPAGTVVLEHGRGFTLNDRLVRPAMVGVAAPAAAPGGGNGQG
jgi:molecular chaperone GrpE